jgi:hypothetical protein
VNFSDLPATGDLSLTMLIEMHDRYPHDLGLPDCLGDGVLLHRFEPLAACRKRLLRSGYAFERRNLVSRHSMFPVLELLEIFRARRIPYYPTAQAARAMLESQPHLLMPDGLFRDTCVSTHAFHESAHALFYEEALALTGKPEGRAWVEILTASEAFAMAFEQYIVLASVADERRSTSLFLAMNSYAITLDGARPPFLDKPDVARLGALAMEQPSEVVTFLFHAFLIALLRPTASSGLPGLAERLAQLACLREVGLDDAEHLLRIGLRVDMEFRGRTQCNLYRLLGLANDHTSMLAQPLDAYVSHEAVNFGILAAALECVFDHGTGSAP